MSRRLWPRSLTTEKSYTIGSHGITTLPPTSWVQTKVLHKLKANHIGLSLRLRYMWMKQKVGPLYSVLLQVLVAHIFCGTSFCKVRYDPGCLTLKCFLLVQSSLSLIQLAVICSTNKQKMTGETKAIATEPDLKAKTVSAESQVANHLLQARIIKCARDMKNATSDKAKEAKEATDKFSESTYLSKTIYHETLLLLPVKSKSDAVRDERTN